MKKIIVSMLTLAAVLVVIPMFAAFEAHVINVTATIENALSVPVTPIKFGTVFPQEHLNKTLAVALSNSFLVENRVDDVKYIIRQKPKCAWSWQDNNRVWMIDEESTQTGHVSVGTNGEEVIDCGPTPINPPDNDGVVGVPDSAIWGVLPSLCQYISKHPDGVDDKSQTSTNDGSLNSFHQPWVIDANGQIDWTDVNGYLAKSQNDTTDTWTIDLAVPCFGGYCAQDWLSFVRDISKNENMTQEEANQYTQPIENEHKVFGCDLWVEVTGVSEAED